MLELAFALLDLRRLVHVAVIAVIVAGAHAFGSPGIRAEVDRLVVTPVSQAAGIIERQLEYPLAVARSAAKLLGWN